MNIPFQPHAHHILMHDQLIILNEREDSYIILDESQSRALVNGDTRSASYLAVITELSKLGIINNSAEKLQPLNKACESYEGLDNYVWKTNNIKTPSNTKLLPTLRALMDLFLLKINLAWFGLEDTLNEMRASKNKATSKIPLDRTANLEHYVRGIHIASLVLPFKIKCLESSICIFKHATRNNFSCDFFIGVQLYDFLSHAWVEIDGQVIADDKDLSKKLPKILTI